MESLINRRRVVTGVASLVVVQWLFASAPAGSAAESITPPLHGNARTQVVVKLATNEILEVQSRFEDHPPTIVIDFPEGRIAASIPERSVIERGVIQEIQTSYTSSADFDQARWVSALRIQLGAIYEYTVRAEPGQIVITIDHPSVLPSEAIEVALAGSRTITRVLPPTFSERFTAMQQALMRARPQPSGAPFRAASPRTPQITEASQPAIPSAPAVPVAFLPTRFTAVAQPWTEAPAVASIPSRAPERTRSQGAPRGIPWWWAIGVLGVAGGLGVWWRRRQHAPLRVKAAQSRQISSGMRVIDQLVWRALERQGFQPLHAVEVDEPRGLMRVTVKEGQKTAVLCIGDGPFFEKATVEQFVRAMEEAKVAQGYLVASGAFTVPAQRYAKANHVTLIGRDQLTELLSAGAVSEHTANQLRQVQIEMDETKATLGQYAHQLDVIRRQRNESSWYLGEERARAGKLEAELDAMNQELRQAKTDTDELQNELTTSRKQWDESQWYLGEARETIRQHEEEIRVLQEAYNRLEATYREVSEQFKAAEQRREESSVGLEAPGTDGEAARQEAGRMTGKLEQTERNLEAMREALDEARGRVAAETAARQDLEAELFALHLHGERRRAARRYRSDVTVELRGLDGGVLFQGIPRDMSSTGLGVDASDALKLPKEVQVSLTVPDRKQAIHAMARLVWQGQDAATNRYRGGCHFVKLTPKIRKAVERALTTNLS